MRWNPGDRVEWFSLKAACVLYGTVVGYDRHGGIKIDMESIDERRRDADVVLRVRFPPAELTRLRAARPGKLGTGRATAPTRPARKEE